MKKILFLLFLMLGSGAIFAQRLSFRFSNPRIIRLSGVDNLQFDVQVMATAEAYLWSTQVALNFNNTTFDINPSHWTVTRVGPFSGNNSSGNQKYGVITHSYGTAPGESCGIALSADINKFGVSPSGSDFGLIPSGPDSWITMITVSAPLSVSSGDGLAGIDFLETSMNGQASFITAANNTTPYSNPNNYDSRDFLTAYTGRIYSTAYGWSQIGGDSDGVPYKNWSSSVSTTVWEGNAAMPAGTSLAKALQIQNPATVTIPVDGALTVSGATDVGTASGLILQSGSDGTGSMITGTATSTGSGSTIARRYMTTGRWHIVSSPVGQTIKSFLTSNTNVQTNLTNGARGMMDYNPFLNQWNSFFTDNINGNVGAGKGFCLRAAADGNLSFAGSLQAEAKSATGLGATFWNCVGNPYSSAIGINDWGSTGATNNFLKVNAANLDPVYGAVYIWDQLDAQNGIAGKYTVISNSHIESFNNIQQEQAFMVRMNTGKTAVDFTPAMQFHNPGLPLKSAESVWPSIKLIATVDAQTNVTYIAYNSLMTKGLDPTYDAGLLKGGSDLLIYTMLVQDNGIPFAIQALPDNDYNSMIIPVGIDTKTGGEVVFSAETFNLPSDLRVILEDKQAATFTDLSSKVYKVTLAANSVIPDRFRLHASTTVIDDVGDLTLPAKLEAYAYQNIEIRVIGEVSKNAVATLYDVLGKVVITQKMIEGQLNVIPTSCINSGLYLLLVKDGGKSQSFKILLKQ